MTFNIDAAVEAACSTSGITSRAAMRAAIEAAIPHLHPQPAELAVQQRAGEQWIGEDGPHAMWVFLDPATNVTGYSETGPELARPGERAVKFVRALAATGKQQVGEVQEPFCYLGEYDANYIERNRPGQAQCVLFKGRHPKKSVPLFRAPAQGIDLGPVREFIADCAANSDDVHIPTVRSERAIKLLALIDQREVRDE